MSPQVAGSPKRRRNDLSLVESQPGAAIISVSHDEVERRAYQRFIERGRADGADLDDWLEAERELLASRSPHST